MPTWCASAPESAPMIEIHETGKNMQKFFQNRSQHIADCFFFTKINRANETTFGLLTNFLIFVLFTHILLI